VGASTSHNPVGLHGLLQGYRYLFTFTLLIKTPEGEGPLWRHRHKWEDNIKMDVREIGWGGKDWIHLAQNRDQWRVVVNTAGNLRFA
jgi:hypothetical protein